MTRSVPSQDEVLSRYTLELIGPRTFKGPFPLSMLIPRAYQQEIEENITDLLPDGYWVRITEETAT